MKLGIDQPSKTTIRRPPRQPTSPLSNPHPLILGSYSVTKAHKTSLHNLKCDKLDQPNEFQ